MTEQSNNRSGAGEGMPASPEQSMQAHLSQIQTMWTAVREAHGEDEAGRRRAQELLLGRYRGAIRRYLLAMLRDEELADDLLQEFSLRFLRGDFRRAAPDRGRFRSYVKSSVYRLVMDHHRGRKKSGVALTGDEADATDGVETPSLEASDEAFVKSWREHLLDRAWKALAEGDEKAGTCHHAALTARVEAPELRSAALAEVVAARTGREVTEGSVRVMIHRARERFAESLLAAVGESVAGAGDEAAVCEAVEQELIDLQLLHYCRPALEKQAKE